MSAPIFNPQPSIVRVTSPANAVAKITFNLATESGPIQTGNAPTFSLQKKSGSTFVDVSGATFDVVTGSGWQVFVKYSMVSIKDTVVFRVRATNTFGVTNSNEVTLSPPAPAQISVAELTKFVEAGQVTPTDLKNIAEASVATVNALFAAPPAQLKELITTSAVTSSQLADLAVTLKKVNPTGEASIVIDGTKVIIPEVKNGKIVAPVSSGSNKIRIPDGVTMSDVIVINAADTTVQYKGQRGSPLVRYFEVKEVGKAAVQLNDGQSTTLSDGTILELSWGSINIDVTFGGGSANTFPARVNPYLAIGNVLIYNKATIDALVAGVALPAVRRVTWAPLGVTAGSLMRALERVVVVADAEGRHLQRWVRIQYINGVGSEGVNDTLADYGCGWICVWDASGVAPIY